MKTLEEVRQQFPRAIRAPRGNCKYCDGTGERKNKPGLPCICIFVEHKDCDWVAESLSETARKALDKLRSRKT